MSSDAFVRLDAADMGTSSLPGRGVLDISVVRSLSQRSDSRGFLRFGIHLSALGLTGALVWWGSSHWYLLIPAMILHGFTLVTMFAAMHECVHKTAFATPQWNEVVGWLAGFFSFYNFTYYRYYHTWHHRYTQDPERDPELATPGPRSFSEYLWELSAIPFWMARPPMFAKLALGMTESYRYVPADARRKIAISAAIQLTIYVAGMGLVVAGYSWPLQYFFLPALLGQPLLRAILIAEHTGCATDDNSLTNTRTTLTSFPIRLLMWNMPYHTEHHLYPSIPFHQLPAAHLELRQKLVHLASSYIAANRSVIQSFGRESRKE